MEIVEKVIWICCLTIVLMAFLVGAYLELYKREVHTPKFAVNQCFVKGLREPWDADVEGMVIRKGYHKYLVMYASEANRNSLGAKQGWEEDIRSFDERYVPAPCPETWITKKRS